MSRVSSSNYTRAFSLSPSGNWDGNDGAWSTFTIRVGTPAQLFRVLPSTSGQEIWIPIPDQCEQGQSWCGNARGVEPFNGAGASPFSGSPNEQLTTSLDPGLTCTANRSPMCINCISIDGKCTNGPCTGRNCCGDPAGNCNGQGCNGLNGICTGPYIGCPCVGPDYNADSSVSSSPGVLNAAAASGFQTNQSSTWSGLGTQDLLTDSYLNVSSNALYGADVVGLGVDANTGLTVNHNMVAGISTEPFYTGMLGLKTSNSTPLNNGTATLLTQLKHQNFIPSLSYGYTAGAIYRQPPVLGSLTLGGYDSSRSLPTNLSFPLAGNDSASLVVGIKSITASNTLTRNVSILSNGVVALIDTTLPFLWLPISACQMFEEAFGLTWNDLKNLYLINDTAHQQLLNTNPSVTFVLGNLAQAPSINITLPYGAFDLQASNPIFENGTNYFPLKRAVDTDQYTLGRAFLQEAFLLVDYEQSNFSISQAQFPATESPILIAIDHSARASPANASGNPLGHSSHNLTHGAIAGAVIGSSIAVVLLIAFAVFLLRRHRQRQQTSTGQLSTDTLSTTQRKESWPNSPESAHPWGDLNSKEEEVLGGELATSGNSRITSKIIGELEDPVTSLTSPNMSENPASRRLWQELPGGETAKELPPTPPEKARHVYELANNDGNFDRHRR